MFYMIPDTQTMVIALSLAFEILAKEFIILSLVAFAHSAISIMKNGGRK